MKKFISFFLILITVASCISDKSINKSTKNLSEIKPKLSSILEGDWVLVDYVQSIDKTLSPIKSANKLKGIVTIFIPENNSNDTIEIGASLNNHEGYNFRVFLSQG